MNAKIQKWGNSLALRIPKAIAVDTDMRTGTIVELAVQDGKVLVSPVRERALTLDELLKGVSAENLHAEVDTGAAVGREV
ncbi:MAG: hypothetical protein A2516_06340, partial [Alphaproteobacteria bacterium RIFOXYD12_FULL_60_8]